MASKSPKDIMCDLNILYKAYLSSLKGSKWKQSSQNFQLNFLENLIDLKTDLENQTLRNGHQTEFLLSERGNIRAITSIPIRDRIVRHALCDYILYPEIKKRIIYDNGASIKGRGLSFQRKRFEVHLRKFYQKHSNNGYILFGDFSKFYDNIHHDIAKQQFLDLYNNDTYLSWLLDLIFEGFEVDVSYMSDAAYSKCMIETFNRLSYRNDISDHLKTGEKMMKKSVNIGDQLSQLIGIYYPNEIDTYVKYVRHIKNYARYMDDWYLFSENRDELLSVLNGVSNICYKLGIKINNKKTRIVRMDSVYKFLQVKYHLTYDGVIIKRVNPKRLSAMRTKLRKMKRKVESGERRYEIVEEMFMSWIGNYFSIMSRKQRESMFKLYENLFNKRIVVKHKRIYKIKEV